MQATAASKSDPRNVLINIRARQNQRDLIDLAAEAVGKSRSEFMLEIACREAEAVLLDRRFFQLDEEDHRRFVELLDAPGTPAEGLRKLLGAAAPWR